jgi:putative DNA primase/helicase
VAGHERQGTEAGDASRGDRHANSRLLVRIAGKAWTMTPLPFDDINRAALASGRSLLERLIPGGKFRSHEYVVRNPRRNDHNPGSFSINYKTGQWADFATDERGGDLISLVAYLRGIEQGAAARELADMIGYSLPKMNGHANGHFKGNRPPINEEAEAPSLPPRTQPGADGKPRFIAGDVGPPVGRDELRRHVYRRANMSVRIKIRRTNGDFVNWYRVVGGWQSGKPAEYIDVPYVGAINPFDPEIANEPIFWPEGERDCDTLGLRHLPTLTFGGTGDGLPANAVEYVTGRDVVILVDNDDPGRKHAQAKAVLAHGKAATVKVIELPGLPLKNDVTDWIAQGTVRTN